MLTSLKQAAMLTAGLTAILGSSTTLAADKMPSQAEMWKIIQQQQNQIQALTAQQSTTDAKIEATSDIVEQVQASSSNGGGFLSNTQIGGYGELHYNGLKDDASDEIDFHRFVLFFGHEFNDSIRFFSELEVEHSIAGDGKNGEVEIEQAFIEFDINKNLQAKAGIFLVPVGIINETHEPPTFFGVERNPVEKNIIPATWWEAGAALNGKIDNGFSYDVAIHSGLNTPTTGSNSFKIRSGRQKVSEADADKGAVTGRLKWTGIPGVELATTLQYQQDVTQANSTESVSATLFETHADIRKGPWGLRALYARWDLDGTAAEAIGRDEQTGFYVEPSYRFDTPVGEAGVFARYNQYDNNAGSGSNVDTEFVQYDVGANYWPHKDVVLKIDMQFNEAPNDGDDDEILNVGIGYQF